MLSLWWCRLAVPLTRRRPPGGEACWQRALAPARLHNPAEVEVAEGVRCKAELAALPVQSRGGEEVVPPLLPGGLALLPQPHCGEKVQPPVVVRRRVVEAKLVPADRRWRERRSFTVDKPRRTILMRRE